MKVLIRTDASKTIGAGHVMRCLSLADSLSSQRSNVSFISKELPGNLFAVIEKRGFPILHKDSPCDWLIVDHYDLNKSWESQARTFAKKIMVIDDFSDREHDCDVLLNQNFYENPASLYEGLLPSHCQKLIGPRFALLNSTFQELRKNLRKRDGSIKSGLIFFGSSDSTQETEKALQAISLLNHPETHWNVIVGGNNERKISIEEQCRKIPNVTFYCQTDHMPQLMNDADIALGAGGSSTWERCCMGLPSLLVSTINNQENIAKSASAQNFGVYLGPSEEVTPKTIANRLKELLENPKKILQFSENAITLVDGRGAERVGEILSQ